MDPVTVRIGRPRLDEDGMSWSCRYSISMGHQIRAGKIHGVDGYQALELVFNVLAVEIEMFGKRIGVSLDPMSLAPGGGGQ